MPPAKRPKRPSPRPSRTAARAKHGAAADTTEAVDEFMRTLAHPHKEAIESLRRIILAVDGSIAEGVKWNAPSFRTTEYFATIHLRGRRGPGVILHLGAKARDLPPGGLAISDPRRLLRWLAADRAMVEFEDGADLEQKRGAFSRILRQWIRHVRA